MRRGMSLLVLLIVSAAGIATAQTARLTAEEARGELFGVELAGVNETDGGEWRECIEPGGRTVFHQRDGQRLEGNLEIRPNGQACFHYGPGVGSACYSVVREGENYRFGDFVTRTVRRGVQECGAVNDAFVRLGASS